jgi:single-stranded-DNA-specific exonuclease
MFQSVLPVNYRKNAFVPGLYKMNSHTIVYRLEACMLRFIQRDMPERLALGMSGLPDWFSAILMKRGVDTNEKAQLFLHPALNQLHDPYLMTGMDAAVHIIRSAVVEKESIVIYGDYDVDGVCAASMMLLTLRSMGAKADYYIPSRHDEGYGLNEQAVKTLAKGVAINTRIPTKRTA